MQNIDAVSVERVEEALNSKNVFCIASGEKDGELRFYFYSRYVN
jgi:Beta2-adaptin appendage, C-terminal sub-domain